MKSPSLFLVLFLFVAHVVTCFVPSSSAGRTRMIPTRHNGGQSPVTILRSDEAEDEEELSARQDDVLSDLCSRLEVLEKSKAEQQQDDSVKSVRDDLLREMEAVQETVKQIQSDLQGDLEELGALTNSLESQWEESKKASKSSSISDKKFYSDEEVDAMHFQFTQQYGRLEVSIRNKMEEVQNVLAAMDRNIREELDTRDAKLHVELEQVDEKMNRRYDMLQESIMRRHEELLTQIQQKEDPVYREISKMDERLAQKLLERDEQFHEALRERDLEHHDEQKNVVGGVHRLGFKINSLLAAIAGRFAYLKWLAK